MLGLSPIGFHRVMRAGHHSKLPLNEFAWRPGQRVLPCPPTERHASIEPRSARVNRQSFEAIERASGIFYGF